MLNKETKTREEWLVELLDGVRPIFEGDASVELPQNIKVACGWPSVGGLSKNKRRVGECWASTASEGGDYEIFISPFLSDPVEVAAVLVHELCHVVAGVEKKHGTEFKQLAHKVRLEGKASATKPSEDLKTELIGLVGRLGEYPHASLDAKKTTVDKQTTRMIKLLCDGCGYVCRTTKRWITKGLPVCCCGVKMVVDDGLVDESDLV